MSRLPTKLWKLHSTKTQQTIEKLWKETKASNGLMVWSRNTTVSLTSKLGSLPSERTQNSVMATNLWRQRMYTKRSFMPLPKSLDIEYETVFVALKWLRASIMMQVLHQHLPIRPSRPSLPSLCIFYNSWVSTWKTLNASKRRNGLWVTYLISSKPFWTRNWTPKGILSTFSCHRTGSNTVNFGRLSSIRPIWFYCWSPNTAVLIQQSCGWTSSSKAWPTRADAKWFDPRSTLVSCTRRTRRASLFCYWYSISMMAMLLGNQKKCAS